jgi:uncharacterized protein (TIGR02996 family)
MNSDQAFLDALRAQPADDTTRLVYADWLEEHGDPRGRYLRLEIELDALKESDPRVAPLEQELRLLRQACDADWLDQAGKRFDVWLLGYTLSGVGMKRALVAAIGRVATLPEPEAAGLAEHLPQTILHDVRRDRGEQARDILRQALEAWGLGRWGGTVRAALAPARSPRPGRGPASARTGFILRLVRPPSGSRDRVPLIAVIQDITGRSLRAARDMLEEPNPLLSIYPSATEAAVAASRFAGLADVQVEATDLPPQAPPALPGPRFALVLRAFPAGNRVALLKALHRVFRCAFAEAGALVDRPLPLTVVQNVEAADAEWLRHALAPHAEVEVREVRSR